MNMRKNYNVAPMMDQKTFDLCEGYDLNNTSKEVLDNFIKEKTIIWVTDIQLMSDEGIMPSGERYMTNRIVHNYIVPCIVQKIKNTYCLRDMWMHCGKDKYNELVEKYSQYEFGYGMETKCFNKASGFFPYQILDEDVHASTSYEYINRVRHNEEQKLKQKEETIWQDEPIKEIKTFSIEEAKKALSKVHNIPVSEIVINIQ